MNKLFNLGLPAALVLLLVAFGLLSAAGAAANQLNDGPTPPQKAAPMLTPTPDPAQDDNTVRVFGAPNFSDGYQDVNQNTACHNSGVVPGFPFQSLIFGRWVGDLIVYPGEGCPTGTDVTFHNAIGGHLTVSDTGFPVLSYRMTHYQPWTPTPTATATNTPVPVPTDTPTAEPTEPVITPVPPTPTSTPCVQHFTDVGCTSTFYTYIEFLYGQGAVGGYADGTFRPQNNATRGQIAKIVSEAAGFNDPVPSTQQHFSDVPPGSTFWVWIERLASRNIVSGYGDGTYHPENNVTRGQASKIIAITWWMMNWPMKPLNQ
jgi:hypothetical protein